LSHDIVDGLFAYEGEIVVDLESQSVVTTSSTYSFEVDAERKRRLLNGLDDIALTLQHEEEIRQFESEYLKQHPWL